MNDKVLIDRELLEEALIDLESGMMCNPSADTLHQLRAPLTAQPQARAAQSAPAGEREALQRLLDDVRDVRNADDVAFGWDEAAEYFGAAWQRPQSAGVPSVQISGHLDEVDAPVWDFINAEARKLGTITGSIDNYGLSRPNGAQPNGGVAVLWNGQKIHAIAVVVRDAMNRTQCVRVLAAAPAQPAAQSELPAEVIAAAIRSVPAWSEISADLLAWEIFDYLYPGQKRKTVNGHYINCNAVSQYPAGKCNCGKGE